MTQDELKTTLDQLIAKWEQETIEFKEANDNFSTNEIGKYVSALANEANLSEAQKAWLVFGVNNLSRAVVGTDYREDSERLQSLKQQIAENTEPSISFRTIHELDHHDGRVILFAVPSAPRGIPISWKGHYYARNGESLASLHLDKLDEIRAQTQQTDWTAQVVPSASITDLDPDALREARKSFTKKYANRFQDGEVAGWSDSAFLARARLTNNGLITRTCLLLLGNKESTHLLSPHPAQLTWKLEGMERAYQHFDPPFLLSSSQLYQKIRNIQLRILPADELIPVEVAKYDQKIVLEALHNCIAHQDYTRNARVVVTESPHALIFDNEGAFFEGQPTDYLTGEKTPHRYRNPCLTQAMVELNMIDTMGYGIHEMHLGQARRYFPLPDYDLTAPQLVRLTIHGKVVDLSYSRLLIENSDLSLVDIFALDRVQKKLPLPDAAIKRLRGLNLIEGRKPNFRVSAQVARAAHQQSDYIKNKGLDDDFYKQLILEYLQKFKSAGREEIDRLLEDKLGNILNTDQKKTKISNLLTALRRTRYIENNGSRTKPEWRIPDQLQKECRKNAERMQKEFL